MFKRAQNLTTAVSLAIMVSLVGNVPAASADTRPATIHQSLHLVDPVKPDVPGHVARDVTPNSVKITWTKAANAKYYKACLLTSSTATSCKAISAATTGTSVTFMGLAPTGGTDYYYRVTAYNDTLSTTSARVGFNLPVAPIDQAKVVSSPASQMSLTWLPALNAESYVVKVATNAAMSTGVLKFSTTSPHLVTTGLRAGVAYYFQVLGIKDGVASSVMDAQRLIPTVTSRVVVMTYNLCGQDKCLASGVNMTHWPVRKHLAGAIVRSSGAGIIATQESGVDTNLLSELPGYGITTYKSAKSLFYDKAKYTALRSGWIELNTTGRYAVWAEFKDRLTGGRFIVGDAHLTPYKGATNDAIRSKETSVLISEIKRNNPESLPVVYAGDYNSNYSNAKNYSGGFDAPRDRFATDGAPDAADITPRAMVVNYGWNSANQAYNPPKVTSNPVPYGYHVDHIYVSRGIKSARWKVLIVLNKLNTSLYSTPFASDHNPVRSTLIIPLKL